MESYLSRRLNEYLFRIVGRGTRNLQNGDRDHYRQRHRSIPDPEGVTHQRPGPQRCQHRECVADDDMRKEIAALAHEEITAARTSFRTIEVTTEQLAFAAYRASQSQERAELHSAILSAETFPSSQRRGGATAAGWSAGVVSLEKLGSGLTTPFPPAGYSSMLLPSARRGMYTVLMPDNSFDVVSIVDMPEVLNAAQQARKEIQTRFDLKDSKSQIELNEKDKKLVVQSIDDFKVKAVVDVLQQKLAKRKVPLKNFSYGPIAPAAGGTARQEITIQSGIPVEKCREIVKKIKDSKIKIQASIQGDFVRVSGKSRDLLQEVIQLLRASDFGLELQFTNYRTF